MLPGDRLVCGFVKPQEVGSEFTAWPLHITIVPWFRVDVPTSELAGELERRLRMAGASAFNATVGTETKFGNKTVDLLATAIPFMPLEQTTRRTLKAHDAWIVDETTEKHRTFVPHITAQEHERAQKGQVIRCNRLYVVMQQGATKVVTAEVKFGNG